MTKDEKDTINEKLKAIMQDWAPLQNPEMLRAAVEWSIQHGGHDIVHGWLERFEKDPLNAGVNRKSVVMALLIKAVQLCAESGLPEEQFMTMVKDLYQSHRDFTQFLKIVEDFPEDEQKQIQEVMKETYYEVKRRGVH